MAVGAQLARQVHGHLPRQIGKSDTDTQCCLPQAYLPKAAPPQVRTRVGHGKETAFATDKKNRYALIHRSGSAI